MATRSEVDSYQSVIDGLSAVAFAQVKALLQSLDTPNPITFRDALLATYPELMAPFLSAAGDVAAQWYAELRANSGVAGAVAPFIAAVPVRGQLDAVVRYSLSPLFKSQEFIGSGILELLAGATQKLIANQGRDTIEGSTYRDRVRVGWARIPQAGCCSFCALLASRGPVYSSAEAAGIVLGRGVDASVTAGKRGGQGKGVKIRGTQGLGNRYHNHCRCVAAPVFIGGDNSYVKYTEEFYTKQYTDLEAADGSIRPLGEALTLKGVLADWRFTHGTK